MTSLPSRAALVLAPALCCMLALASRAHASPLTPMVQPDSLRDLPIVEVPASGTSTDAMAVILSGDGGWADIDRQIGTVLAADGVPVVGLDSRHYFRHQRTPEEASRDLARIIDYYLPKWGKSHVILVGYSHGADVLPFMAADLPASVRAHVSEVALLGVAHNANFKFHAIDLVMDRHRQSDFQTLPEIEALKGMPILCFYGEKEKDTACRDLGPSQATVIAMPGGHHLGGQYQAMAARIFAAGVAAGTPAH